MRGAEKTVVLGALIYMAVYIPCVILAVTSTAFSAAGDDPGAVFRVILPFHFFGMALNLVALILTIRDLYLRDFGRENAKLTWLLLILMTGGIGWVIYILRHALKPRPAGGEPTQ